MAEEKKASEAAEAQEAQAAGEEKEITTDKAEAKDAGNVVEAKEEKTQDSVAIGDLNFLSDVRTDLPEIKPGNVVRVFYRVIEGGKERIQVFEGTVIAMKNRGIARTITVRKTSFGIAVERIFPLNSKLVQKIELKKRQKVRRAKLYYLRNLKGKAARLKELR
jgi:large subunit ribosomal protein L19